MVVNNDGDGDRGTILVVVITYCARLLLYLIVCTRLLRNRLTGWDITQWGLHLFRFQKKKKKKRDRFKTIMCLHKTTVKAEVFMLKCMLACVDCGWLPPAGIFTLPAFINRNVAMPGNMFCLSAVSINNNVNQTRYSSTPMSIVINTSLDADVWMDVWQHYHLSSDRVDQS